MSAIFEVSKKKKNAASVIDVTATTELFYPSEHLHLSTFLHLFPFDFFLWTSIRKHAAYFQSIQVAIHVFVVIHLARRIRPFTRIFTIKQKIFVRNISVSELYKTSHLKFRRSHKYQIIKILYKPTKVGKNLHFSRISWKNTIKITFIDIRRPNHGVESSFIFMKSEFQKYEYLLHTALCQWFQ